MFYLINLEWLPGQLCWREDSGKRAYWEENWGWLPRASVKGQQEGHKFATFAVIVMINLSLSRGISMGKHLKTTPKEGIPSISLWVEQARRVSLMSTHGRWHLAIWVQQGRSPPPEESCIIYPVPEATSLTMKIHLIEKCHYFWSNMKVIFYVTQEKKSLGIIIPFTIPIS